MIRIRAGQHFFGNVERENSPRGIGGFQTLLYTQSALSPDEARAMEPKLVYFVSETAPVKTVFFALTETKYVVSRIVHVADVDKFGRKGSHLAHSLIIQLDEFGKVGYDPFVVLEFLASHSIKTTAEALQMGDESSANVDWTMVEIPEEDLHSLESETDVEFQKWETQELLKIAHCIMTNKAFMTERKSLVLFGSTSDIERALRAAFALVPEKERLSCSFDTYFDGCNPVASYFWAIGYSRQPNPTSRHVLVDAVERRVFAESPLPTTPYERWLFSCITRGEAAKELSLKSQAVELHQFLTDQPCDKRLLSEVDPDFVRTFLELSWPDVSAKIDKALRAAIGENLSARVGNYIIADCRSMDGRRLLHCLLDGFNLTELAEEVCRILRKSKPSKREMTELTNLQAKTGHPILGLLLAYWAHDYDSLRRRLGLLTDERYRMAVELFLEEGFLPVDTLFVLSSIESFIAVLGKRLEKDPRLAEQIPKLVERLLSSDFKSFLPKLAPLLQYLNQKQLKSVNGLVRDKRDIPPDFAAALQKAIALHSP
jgi:hypothetical protein